MTYGTATTTKQLVALLLLPGPPVPSQSSLDTLFNPPRVRTEQPSAVSPTQQSPMISAAPKATIAEFVPALAAGRETTPREHMIGELRSWKQLSGDWDGENAAPPLLPSLDDAVSFSKLLDINSIAQPMLHASGHAGLFWRTGDLYADLEFLGSSRIAYFIEKKGDKHKGVVNFVAKEMPHLFKALLPA
jgi:hypothetical protein